jgi:hypothetical protein
MRHLLIWLCTTGAACGFTSQAFGQTASPLAFTLDLMAPCSGSTCNGTHPTDSGFQTQAAGFKYAAGSDTNGSFGLATLQGLTAPMVCDEVSQGSAGAVGSSRFAPEYSNAILSGGVLDFNDFNVGGDTVVDLSSLIYDGSNPAGVASSYSNYSGHQVTCYSVNPVTGGARSDAPGPADTVLHTSFEDHYGNEPWVSVQTINSPHTTGTSAPTGTSGVTTPNQMDYVVQIHNAAHAAGWRLMLGYDHAYFSTAASGYAPLACVLGSSQPGSAGTCSSDYISLPYTLQASDVQTATNSIYIQVSYTGSSAATANWSSMTGAFYPAVAAVFPPFGTYPQRFDDKTAVASANNVPKVNVTNIVCNNDHTSTTCQVYGTETGTNGGALSPTVLYANTISGSGALVVDPMAYFVDPYSGNTLPGTNATADALTATMGCNFDPNNWIIRTASVGVSPSAPGALALNLAFRASGSLYVAGTETCDVVYTTSNSYSPKLSVTQRIVVTMLPAAATHFTVTAPSSATAGSAFNNLVVTALDSANNVVGTYGGTVGFTSSDAGQQLALPINSTLTNGTGMFSATLVTAGSRTITATDTISPSITGTSGNIAVAPGAAANFAVQALSPQTHGQPFQVSVAAKDAYGNTATGYAGTVHFSAPSDPNAVLPADQTLTSGVASPLPLVTLNTTGTQTVTVTDTANASVTGSSSSIAVN